MKLFGTGSLLLYFLFICCIPSHFYDVQIGEEKKLPPSLDMGQWLIQKPLSKVQPLISKIPSSYFLTFFFLIEIMHAVGRHEYEIVQWYYRAKLAFGEMKDYDFRTPLHVSVSEGLFIIFFYFHILGNQRDRF